MPGECGPRVRWSAGSAPPVAALSLARGGRRDVVHTHLSHADAVGVLTIPAHRGRLVATRHIAGIRGSSAAARNIGRAVSKALACEIAISRFVAAALERSPSEILHNGVALNDSAYDVDSRTVLVAQRLEREKDTATAIRAWAQSSLPSAGWQLDICGDGSERAALEWLARSAGVADSVRFLGWVRDIGRRLGKAGILLATAPAEPLGLTVLESMAAGVPVVAAAAGGHLETIGGVEDVPSFVPGDAAAAAAALELLAQSAELRQQLSSEVRALQRERFSMAGHVTRLEGIYADLAGR